MTRDIDELEDNELPKLYRDAIDQLERLFTIKQLSAPKGWLIMFEGQRFKHLHSMYGSDGTRRCIEEMLVCLTHNGRSIAVERNLYAALLIRNGITFTEDERTTLEDYKKAGEHGEKVLTEFELRRHWIAMAPHRDYCPTYTNDTAPCACFKAKLEVTI